MAKEIMFGNEMQQKLLSGMKKVADAVGSTLGPAGRTVIMEQAYGDPLISKDGVTVAKSIELEDKEEDLGAKLIKSIASKTDNTCGDGTSTSTVLAASIVEEGIKSVSSGVNPINLKKGINKAVEDAVALLKERSVEVEDKSQIAQVASISANNDEEIGNEIANAMEKLGDMGVITVQESKSTETYTEMVEGMEINSGYLSPYFCNDINEMKANFSDPYILLYDKCISNVNDIIPILQKVTGEGGNRPLLIIADDVTEEVLTMLVVNTIKGTLKVCAIKASSVGARKKGILEDIAALTGGKLIDESLGMSLYTTSLEDLGRAASAVISKDSTVIIDGYGTQEQLQERIVKLKKEMEECTSDYDREKTQERLAKLTGGIAIIKVGALTDTELKEKKHRVEDSVNATRAAVEEGIVAGGGTTLCQISHELSRKLHIDMNREQVIGYNIVVNALTKPMTQIAINAGVSGEVVVDKCKNSEKGVGYNALTGEWGDMVGFGVIDPTKVVRCALQNAASVASLAFTSSCTITTIPEKSPQPQMNLGSPMM